jgi:hypothetical protein
MHETIGRGSAHCAAAPLAASVAGAEPAPPPVPASATGLHAGLASLEHAPIMSLIDEPIARHVAGIALSARMQSPHDAAQNAPQGHSLSLRHSRMHLPRLLQK